MTIWFHTTILAVSLAATVAVGIASAAIYSEAPGHVAPKADRLPIAISPAAANTVTVETRKSGLSVLARMPVAPTLD